MNLRTSQRISLAAFATAVTIALAGFGVVNSGYGIYFGIKDDIKVLKIGQEQNAATTAETKKALEERAMKVDTKLETIQASISKVESGVALAQNNQAILSQQLNQVQKELRNFYGLILKEKTAGVDTLKHDANY